MILNDPDALRNADAHGGLDYLMGYPEQASQTLAAQSPFVDGCDWPTGPQAYRMIVIVAFGSPATAADAAAQYAASFAAAPIIVLRQTLMPAYVGPDSLVIVCSYSGETPECSSAVLDARRAGARVVCVTRGGALAEMAGDDPVVRLPAYLRSEFAFPCLFFGILRVLQDLDAAPIEEAETDEAIALMKRQRAAFAPERPEDGNAAKALAGALSGSLPVILAGSPSLAPVVRRWCNQIRSSAKSQALWDAFPELTHTQLLAWRNARRQSSHWAVVILRDRSESPSTAALIEGAAGAIPQDIDVHEVYVDGRSLLARLLTGVYFADMCSAYLALIGGEEPSAV